MSDYDWHFCECGHEWARDDWGRPQCPKCGIEFNICTVAEARQAEKNDADDADKEDRRLKI